MALNCSVIMADRCAGVIATTFTSLSRLESDAGKSSNIFSSWFVIHLQDGNTLVRGAIVEAWLPGGLRGGLVGPVRWF